MLKNLIHYNHVTTLSYPVWTHYRDEPKKVLFSEKISTSLGIYTFRFPYCSIHSISNFGFWATNNYKQRLWLHMERLVLSLFVQARSFLKFLTSYNTQHHKDRLQFTLWSATCSVSILLKFLWNILKKLTLWGSMSKEMKFINNTFILPCSL